MTPVENVYDKFVSLVDDIDFEKFSDEDIEHHFRNWLELAITEFVDFYDKYKPSIEQDNIGNCYIVKNNNRMLTLEETNILAHGMCIFWFDSKVQRKEMLEQRFNTRDYNQLSNANMLAQNKELRKDLRTNFFVLTNRYRNKDEDMGGLN